MAQNIIDTYSVKFDTRGAATAASTLADALTKLHTAADKFSGTGSLNSLATALEKVTSAIGATKTGRTSQLEKVNDQLILLRSTFRTLKSMNKMGRISTANIVNALDQLALISDKAKVLTKLGTISGDLQTNSKKILRLAINLTKIFQALSQFQGGQLPNMQFFQQAAIQLGQLNKTLAGLQVGNVIRAAAALKTYSESLYAAARATKAFTVNQKTVQAQAGASGAALMKLAGLNKKFTNSVMVDWTSVGRFLQANIFTRVLYALMSAIRQAIADAAELGRKIAEVQTIFP